LIIQIAKKKKAKSLYNRKFLYVHLSAEFSIIKEDKGDKNMARLKIAAILTVAIFLISSAYAATLCSYKGPSPDAPDNLQLSDFLVSGDSPVKVDDKVSVSFKLTYVGKDTVTFDDIYGVFVAVKDPDGNTRMFGNTYQGKTLKAGGSAPFEIDITLDKEGEWIFWASYCIKSATGGTKCGPDEWHSCKIKVEAKSICPSGCDCLTPAQAKELGYEYCEGEKIVCGYDQYQNPMYCYEKPAVTPTPSPKITPTPPSVTITHSPVNVTINDNVTFTARAWIGTDKYNYVSRITIFVNDTPVRECSPPVKIFGRDYYQCTYTGGPYPAGPLTYKAEAFDSYGNKGISEEKTIDVTGLTLVPAERISRPTIPPEEIPMPCYISGRLYDFKYYSKTLKVKICEAETVKGSPLVPGGPPQITYPCKPDGAVWYVDVTRLWAGEERYRMPGPMAYQVQVPCDGSYLIQPVYQPFGDECEWHEAGYQAKANSL